VLLQRANAGAARHAVIRAGFWRLSAAGASILLGFCSTVLVARALGPELFGQYAFALWLATAAAPAVGAGMSALTSRVMAGIQSREKPQVVAGIFYFVMRKHSRKMALYCLFYLLLIVPCARFFGGNVTLILLLLAGLSAPPLLSGGVVNVTLRSLRRFDLLAAIHLLGAAITLLLVLLSLQSVATSTDQASLFLLAPAVASMVMLFASVLCIGKLLPLREAREPGTELREQLTRGLRHSLLFVMLEAVVWQHAELIALGRARSAADLGYYMLCVIISTRVMQALPTLYTTCILPLRLRIMAGRLSTNAADASRRTTLSLVWLAIPVCAFGIAYCPMLIGWCFGAAYLPMVMPLRILLVAAAVGSISSVSVTRLAHEDHNWAQAWLSAVGASLTLALAFPLTAFAGITGAAIGSAIAQCVCAFGTMFICTRKTRSRKAS
jgi:O-antigen/teichoic acid export membrane protein